MAASNPWRPTIANAGLIERLMWDIVWDILRHRTPNPMSRQAIGLLVVNPPSAPSSLFLRSSYRRVVQEPHDFSQEMPLERI